MASFDVVNYSLRPSKSIQRQIVFAGMQGLKRIVNLDRMVYVGFGSIWFTDFVMAHKLLSVDDMISIEAHDVGYERARFNAPYATVQVRHGHSTTVLPELYEDVALAARPWMVWLDYDFELNETFVADVRSIIERAPANSVVIVTFNGHEMKYGHAADRPERVRDLLGSVVPDEISKKSFKDDRMQETLADLALDFMKSVAADMARPGGFIPAFRVIYKDGAPMVTVGGMLPALGAARVVGDLINQDSWPCMPSKPIVAPHLTLREATVLQAQLPSAVPLSRALVKQLGFDLEDEQVEAFETYYRQYPAFAQIIA